MPTAFTTLLGLALPVTGDLSGTWGDAVNDSITALLDTAVAGTTQITVDADITLTTSTGVANQARQAILLWTATGSVTRNITAPAQSKAYFIINKTGGTQSIVIRGAGPTTGVTILAGTQSLVVWDNTDFVEIASGNVDGPVSATDNAVARFDGTTGRIIQNSVVTIADTTGNMAGVGTLGVGAITTSGALTYGGVTLSNAVTGTGNMVLSNSPTLVTPALGTPSSAVLTNATGLPISTGVSGLGTGVATFLATPSSANLLAAVTNETGTGALVFATSPTLVTPALGTPSALVGTNITGTAAAFTASNVTTNANLTGAVTSTGNATLLGSFTSAQLAGALTNETGTGSAVFATSPTFVTPALGTPASGVLTNATGLPIATGVSGLGTGVATFLAAPLSANLAAAVTDETGTGSLVFATSPTLVTPALGTPSSGVLTNATGLPIATGVSGLGAGVATFLATPSSANLAAAVTDETGTGALVFATSPTFVTPALGTPASGVVTNLTGTASININGTVGATTRAAGSFTTLDANGNVTLGDATADTITATGRFNTDVVPSTNNTRDLGTAALQWRQVFATTLTENASPVVVQTDIGTAPNEIPLNQYLGEMAYMNAESVVIQPQATAVPNGIGDMVFQLTSDTSLLIRVKGSDGTVRSVTLTLA